MRKSVIAIVVVIATLGAFGAFAAGSPASAATPASSASPMKMLAGSVVSIDAAAKSFVLKESTKDAKDVTVFWGATTKVSGGTLAPGQKVHVSYSEVGGKIEATKVKIEASTAAAKKQ